MIRIGVIGLGMSGHQRALAFAQRDDCVLRAVCDRHHENYLRVQKQCAQEIIYCTELEQLWPHIDALIIATPHWSHTHIVAAACAAGKHILLEKPAAVHLADVRTMNMHALKSNRVFAIHYQFRFRRDMNLIRDLVHSNELGTIRRISWCATQWFRPQAYYDSRAWRGSWQGEGGGVLLNQAAHQLDIWQWIFAMPQRLRAHCHCAKYHDIEVEDEVTAYMEYANGCTGTFIASTAEYPGTDRLEIVGDKGRLLYENGRLQYDRLRRSVPDCLVDAQHELEHWPVTMPEMDDEGRDVIALADNFCAVIRGEEELRCPGASGLNQVLLSNAMLQSTWNDDWVVLDNFDAECYVQQLQERMQCDTSEKRAIDFCGERLKESDLVI